MSRGAVLDPCYCCEPGAPPTPLAIFNRPSLNAIAYRVGTYSSFREAMIRSIPKVGAASLGRWTARESDDYGIALLEMWATLADILTFYQERIANEAFLRSAVQRDSVRRLAGMLDYKLKPGVAASTFLAYTLDEGASVTIPIGLRAQSVPKDGELPQKFETVERIEARSQLNKVRVHPRPDSSVNQLRAEGTWGTLTADSYVPNPGDRLVIFGAVRGTDSCGPAGVEEKQVESVETVEGRTVLTWSPAVSGGAWRANVSRLFAYKRTFRPFGVNAPNAYLEATGATGGLITWEWRDSTSGYSFSLSPGNTLSLDGLYDDIEPGTKILISTPDFVQLATIEGVGQKAEKQGPLEGTVTQLTLRPDVLSIAERRTVRIYELAESEIRFQGWEFPSSFPNAASTLYAPYNELNAIAARSAIVIDDEAGKPAVVTVAADGTPFSPLSGAQPEFLEIALTAPLDRRLDPDTAYLLGNVARATHGETVKNEVLGSGDASQTFQSFALKKSPVTHVASALAVGGALSTLSLRVDQVAWQEVPSLYGRGPKDRVFATELDDKGVMTVRFGDGVTGARLPSGQNNVVAVYRQGLGRDGNLDPGAISVPLDRPVGLKGVTSLAATGGDDPEKIAQARHNVPNTVRTFDRAISLRDFEDLARGFAGVSKAFATWVWDGESQAVHLTVAGPKGASLGPADLKTLRDYLRGRRDPNRSLLIDGYVPVALRLTARLQVDPAYVNDTVEAAARAAIESYFAFENRQFGQPVHLSDVYAVLQSAEGVVSVDVDLLGYKDPVVAAAHGATAGPVQRHIRIDQARANPAPPPKVTPAELAVIGDRADISLTVSGGLSA
jgi:uncharacterized phage protein gp47/JayE